MPKFELSIPILGRFTTMAAIVILSLCCFQYPNIAPASRNQELQQRESIWKSSSSFTSNTLRFCSTLDQVGNKARNQTPFLHGLKLWKIKVFSISFDLNIEMNTFFFALLIERLLIVIFKNYAFLTYMYIYTFLQLTQNKIPT